MAIAYRHTSGRVVTALESSDKPVRRVRERSRLIARLDASKDWERVSPVASAPPVSEGPSPAPDYASMSLVELRKEAKARGLSAAGKKAEIRERLESS